MELLAAKDRCPWLALYVYLIPLFTDPGWDIGHLQALRNIHNGQVFDENFPDGAGDLRRVGVERRRRVFQAVAVMLLFVLVLGRTVPEHYAIMLSCHQ